MGLFSSNEVSLLTGEKVRRRVSTPRALDGEIDAYKAL